MYGAILGDIIGSPFEFDRGDKTKEFDLFSKDCDFTDDSVMTIAVGEALLAVGKEATVKEIEEYKGKLIVADSAEPKTIKYYQQQGFKMKPCKKFAGSRLQNTKKVKRFKKIFCSDECKNTIRELKNLTYKIREIGFCPISLIFLFI